MIVLLWLLLPIGLVLAAGLVLSFSYTGRRGRTSFHSPEEYGLAYERITFKATDGIALRGCWIPARSAADHLPCVIILHGHGGSLDRDLHRAPALHQAGFNVFLFDFRAHGLSDGRVASFGCFERRDVQGAIDFLKSRGVDRIGLLGFSYGGIASLLTAPTCPEIRAVISDGGPVRMRTALIARGKELHVPRWLSAILAWLIIAFASLRLGKNLFLYDTVRWVGRISPRPILFIHGESDLYCADFDDLWAAAAEPKEAWRLPGVGHTKASELYPDEFYRRVVGFFSRNLA